MIGINKPLWIAVNNGEPGTLNLNHQSVSRQECVCHIIQCVIEPELFLPVERQGLSNPLRKRPLNNSPRIISWYPLIG